MKYQKLFEPAQIGRVHLRNRIVMPPIMVSYNAPSGEMTDRMIHYFEERAAGGAGLILVNCSMEPVFGKVSKTAGIGNRNYIRGMEMLTKAVHRHGAKIFAQILPSMDGKGVSNIPTTPALPAPTPLTVEEIHTLEDQFANAAALAIEAGFDGIEVHSTHGHFMAQFLSNYYNKRTDEYGGSLENRMRFLMETIAKTRRTVGNAVPIIVRISGDEFASHISPDCLTLDDGIAIAKRLDESKTIQALDISNSNNFNPNANCEPYSYKPGWKKHIAKAIKAAVSLPIIATNTIKDPKFAESLLEEGVSDFVAIGRGQIADPEFARKTFEGREKEIRQCIGCMYCRESQLGARPVPMRCSVNPRAGVEFFYPKPNKDGNGRTVVVVGAGPSGMQAAIILAKRNFHTVMLEQSDKLGGTLNLASRPTCKESIQTLVDYLTLQMELAGVEIHLNAKADTTTVKSFNPCGVILANGARPIRPDFIPGIMNANVHTAEEVIRDGLVLPGNVTVIGSGMTGLETAEMLAKKGSNITVLEMMPTAGPGLYPIILKDIMGRLNEYNPTILTSHQLTEINEEGVIAKDLKTQLQVSIAAEHVVLSLGVAPDLSLVQEMEANFHTVLCVGDAEKGGRIYQAISTGYSVGYSFKP